MINEFDQINYQLDLGILGLLDDYTWNQYNIDKSIKTNIHNEIGIQNEIDIHNEIGIQNGIDIQNEINLNENIIVKHDKKRIKIKKK
jgi:hypothetical protein